MQAREEAPVLADAVAAHRRDARRSPAARGTRACAAAPRRRSRWLARTRAIRPEEPCWRWFQSSMRASTSSLWWMASSGPSATMLSSLSVTTVAISMIASESGLSPVISRSIQMRLSPLGMAALSGGSVLSGATCSLKCSRRPRAYPSHATDGRRTVIAAFGRHMLVRTGGRRRSCARVPSGARSPSCAATRCAAEIDARHEEVHVLEVLARRTALYRANARGAPNRWSPTSRGCSWCSRRCRCRTCSSSTATWRPPPPPASRPPWSSTRATSGSTRALAAELAVYAAAGYGAIACSADSGAGRGGAAGALLARRHVAALVGQSGVGKSSLVRRLVPGGGDRRSVSWCARRKAGTPPPPRGCSSCPTAPRSSIPRACATSRPRWRRSMSARSASSRSSASPRAAASRTAATCASRAARSQARRGRGAASARRYESYRRLRRLREELTAARGPKPPNTKAGPASALLSCRSFRRRPSSQPLPRRRHRSTSPGP